MGGFIHFQPCHVQVPVIVQNRTSGLVVTGIPSHLALYFQGFRKTFFIQGHTVFFQNFRRQFLGETEGVGKLKGNVPVQFSFASFLQFCNFNIQHVAAALQGFQETALFHVDDFLNIILFLTNLRIVVAVHGNHHIHRTAQELMVDTQQASVTDSPAQDATQNITPAQVGRQNTVADHKGQAAGMVRDHFQGYVRFRGRVVRHSAFLAGIFDNGENQVRLKVGRFALQHRSNPFQPGACIDVLMFQRRVGAVFILVELGEHQVPQFQETPAVAGRSAIRFAAASFRA